MAILVNSDENDRYAGFLKALHLILEARPPWGQKLRLRLTNFNRDKTKMNRTPFKWQRIPLDAIGQKP